MARKTAQIARRAQSRNDEEALKRNLLTLKTPTATVNGEPRTTDPNMYIAAACLPGWPIISRGVDYG